MASEVVKYAPKAVIDELDSWDEYNELTPYELLDEIGRKNSELVRSKEWLNTSSGQEDYPFKQLSIVNHVFGTQRLQPEREPRYYVEFKDTEDGVWKVRRDNLTAAYVTTSKNPVPYFWGLDHETAVKAQALYGGTIKRIE